MRREQDRGRRAPRLRSQNLGLWLDKGIAINLFVQAKAGEHEKGLRQLLQNPNKHLEDYIRDFEPDTGLMQKELSKRAQELKRAAQDIFGPDRVLFSELTLKSPMLIGTGSPGPFETNLFTSAPYGHPDIPGSSVKGLVRAYVAANNLLSDSMLTKVFGDQDQAGGVVWFAGLPLRYKVEISIFNVHYHGYYQDPKDPKNFKEHENPILINMPAVAAGSRYLFGLALSPNAEELGLGLEHLKTYQDFLVNAVNQFGVGSHTRVGFGEFVLDM